MSTTPLGLTDAQKLTALRYAQQVLLALAHAASAFGRASRLVRGTLWLTGISVMADRLERDAASAADVLAKIEQEYAA